METPIDMQYDTLFSYHNESLHLESENIQDQAFEDERVHKLEDWTEVEQDILEKLCADNSTKEWELIADYFPFQARSEIKKRVKLLRKGSIKRKAKVRIIKNRIELKSAPLAKESKNAQIQTKDKMQCIKDLKNRLTAMEKDLLGSCIKIKDLIRNRGQK